MDEGRLLPDGQGGFTYEYFFKVGAKRKSRHAVVGNYLGNTRVSFTDNNNTAMRTQEDSYYPYGMRQGKSYFSGLENKYLYNGKELQDDFGLDWYDYGARFYDAGIARWNVIDPMIEKHYDYTGYAYVYNNPIKLIDPFGLDSLQRAQALNQAEKYINKKADGNQYKMGAKGKPGEKVDCSGEVSNCVVAGGEKDPNDGNEISGVLNIENNTTKITDEKDVVPGNIVTFRNSKGYKYHTGLVKSVERDKNGKIIKVVYYHSHSGVGPDVGTFDVNNPGNLSIHGFYKWDTKPDPVPTNATKAVSIITQKRTLNTKINYGLGITTSIKRAWSNFKYQISTGLSQMDNWIKSGYDY